MVLPKEYGGVVLALFSFVLRITCCTSPAASGPGQTPLHQLKKEAGSRLSYSPRVSSTWSSNALPYPEKSFKRPQGTKGDYFDAEPQVGGTSEGAGLGMLCRMLFLCSLEQHTLFSLFLQDKQAWMRPPQLTSAASSRCVLDA